MATRRWVLATDGSDDARAAQEFLLALDLDPDLEINIVTVVADRAPLLGPYMEGVYANWDVLEEIRKGEQEAAQRSLDAAAQNLRGQGVQVQTSKRVGDPAHEILRLAEELEAECIVLGSKGLTGLESFLLGSVARNVAKHANCPVLIARAPQHGLKRAVVATDGSPFAKDATAFATRLGLPEQTELVAANVTRLYDPFPGVLPTDRQEFRRAVEEVREKQRHAARRFVDEAVATLRQSYGAVSTEVRTGDPANEILRLTVQEEVDLLVMGARGVSAIERLLVGSVADRLLKRATCSILIAH